MAGKVVFYQIVHSGSGNWTVKFWTKEDQSNAIKETFVTLDEAKLKYRIESVLGHKNIILRRVK
jgi:hypothetical protein